MSLMLLASYPKSGNTWMRVLLSNYLADDEPVSINALVNVALQSRHEFDERLGLSSWAMTPDEILLHRPRFHELQAADLDSPSFAKVHECYLRLPDGEPLFPRTAFASVVCIVRNPLDIVVSYAHHMQTSIDRTIEFMAERRAMLSPPRFDGRTQLPIPISDWSGNVSSWLNQDELPRILVRYERLHANPDAVFSEVVSFAGLPMDRERLVKAVENSRFQRLREQEDRVGFRERQPTAPNFFRKGLIGDWRNVLSRKQVQCLVERHGPVMAELGYLDEAEKFLARG